MPNVPSPTFDQYELQTDFSGNVVVLSADGTGSTHRATDTRTGQPVIVRIFSERLLADSSVQREFVSHAKLLIELDHPSVTRIVDTGQYANQFFYVLQDPGGQTLEEWVETSGPMDVALALRLNLQLSEALLAVRSKPGLLSRVWPRSVMRTGEGEASKIHLVAQNLVAPGEEEEQPEFLAPEILAGHQDTAQASLYSIGATLYYTLTGQPPYPSGLPIEDLLELKSTRLPDMTALPEAAPVTLLRQVLDADPRNRPKSLMEWDRALQRFIRFTPAVTSSVTIKPADASPEEEPSTPEAPSAPVESKPLTPFHGSPASATADPELEKAKVHTQRLSVELTKRVQKELALTTQLKTLESELEKERSRVQELTARHPLPSKAEITKLQHERSKINEEWNALKDARKNLEKEQHEFLKKTQRFSVSKAKEAVAKSTDNTLTETQRVTGKPRFFRFGRKGKKASADQAPSPALAPKPEAKPTAKPAAKKVAVEEPKKQAPQKKRMVAQTAPRKQKAEAAAKPMQAKAKPSASKVVTFKQPNAAETPPLNPSKPEPKPAKPEQKTKPQTVQAKTTSKPVSKGATARERLAAETTKPKPQPKATPKPKASKASKPVPAPQYQPLPGAWVALTILAAVIAFGLFLAYRTFYGRQDHYLLGTLQTDKSTPEVIQNAPTVVNIGSDESPAPFEPLVVPQEDPIEALDEASITVTPSETTEPGETPSVPAPAPLSRETTVNEELRVDMKTFNNFLLVQDEEWPELLHSLKGLELPSNKYSEEEINLIRQELYDDLDRKAQLRKNSKDSLLKNPEFKELFDYLKALLPPNPSE